MMENIDNDKNILPGDTIIKNSDQEQSLNNEETSENTVPRLQTRPLIKRLYEKSGDERKKSTSNVLNLSNTDSNKSSEIVVNFPLVECKVEPVEEAPESSSVGDTDNNNENIRLGIKTEWEDFEANIKEEPSDYHSSDDESQQFDDEDPDYGVISPPKKSKPAPKARKRKTKKKPTKELEDSSDQSPVKEWEVELDIPQEIKIGVPDRRRTVKLISEEEASRFPISIPVSRKIKSEPGTEMRRRNRKIFPCKQCSEMFTVHADLRAHIITHQVETRHKCALCSKCFTRAHDLTLHRRVHSGEKPYPCTHCEKRFTQKINMLRHIRIHTHERPFACHMCGDCYIDQGELAKHVRLHTGTLPYFCNLCKERFSSQDEVQTHSMEEHGTMKGVQACAVCGVIFPDRASKKEHLVAAHSEIRPFQCHDCGKSFKLKAHLINHMSVHTGFRAHWCPVCGKSFSGESGRKLHMLRHAGVRPFACRTCSRAFHSRGLLARHERAHSQQRPYTCPTCGLTFKSSDSRHRHQKIVHQRALHEYKCEFAGCLSTYSVKSNMHRHMRSYHYGMKPFQCSLCSGRFTSNSSLASHTKAKHSAIRDHHCQLCPHKFIDLKSLKRHFRTRHSKQTS